MAQLEKIRNKAGFLVAVIGIALFAFVAGDFFRSGSSLFNASKNEVGEIAGTSIDIREYQKEVNTLTEAYKANTGRSALDENMSNQLREQAWNNLLRKYIMDEQYEALGLEVTSKELFDLVQGENLHPMVRQLFQNPQTGQVDRAQIIRTLKNLDKFPPNVRASWLFTEKQLRSQRMMEKYNTLLRQGMYVTTAETEDNLKGRGKVVDFDFVAKTYQSIPDSLIKVSNSDIKSYYENHKKRYKQEASRTIQYVTFDVEASDADHKDAEKWIQDIKKELVELPTSETFQFVKRESDVAVTDRNLTKDETPENLQEWAFEAEVGAVFGPFEEEGSFHLTKLAAINNLPDSVEARIIAIGAQNPAAATKLADSLMTVLKGNIKLFPEVARTYSADQATAQKGGDLGWLREGRLPKVLNDAIFHGKKGDVVKVAMNNAIFLVNIQNQGKAVKKVQLATLVRNIEASSETYQRIYTEANRFRAEHKTMEEFKEGAKEAGLSMRFGNNLHKNDVKVANLKSPRPMVRWAFQTEVGEVSTVYEFGDQFVIAILTEAQEGGYAELNGTLVSQIRRQVMNEKKAEKIIADIKAKKADSQSLASLAQKLETEVQTARGINFFSYQIPGAGFEPALIGAAMVSEKGQISEPIKGNNGVFSIMVSNVETTEGTSDVKAEKQNMMRSLMYRVNYQSFEALRENAEVEDNRVKFQ